MGSQLWGAMLGVAAAANWGAADFSGGVASRRGRVFGVVLGSEIVGLSLLAILALTFAEPLPVPRDLLWAGVAGVAGTVGLVCLYQAMARGHMAVAAPVAAVVTAAVPVVVGTSVEGVASGRQLLGFGLGLAGVWLVMRSRDGAAVRARDLALPLLAGTGFGVFLILIDHVSEAVLFWPLVASRSASVVVLALVVAVAHQKALPVARQLPFAALSGALNSAGNLCYALSARFGRLDSAAVLSSMGPAMTVVLARLFLKESISRQQWLGLAAVLTAVALISQ
jgi:drug/metabolite transporter (DMT)-like permease